MNLSSGLELELFWGSEDNRANLALSKWFLVVCFFFSCLFTCASTVKSFSTA